MECGSRIHLILCYVMIVVKQFTFRRFINDLVISIFCGFATLRLKMETYCFKIYLPFYLHSGCIVDTQLDL